MTPEEARAIIDKAEYWHYAFTFPWDTTTVPGKPGWAERVAKRRRHFFDPLLARYGGSFKGKHVLDLGCCQGYWSFAAREAGAESVVGVDASKAFIQEAKAVQTVFGFDKITFLTCHLEDQWFRLLDSTKHITLLLGTLFHTTDPIYVLRTAMAQTMETIVIDGEVVNKDEPAFYMKLRTPDEPTTKRSDTRSEIRTIPTVSAIVWLLKSGGFNNVQVLEPKDMPPDYHAKTTASIIASR